MDIGENIRRIRKAKKLSQKEVIVAIDMGAAQYSRIENGKTEPSVSTLERIAKALGVKVADLFTEDDKVDLKEVRSQDSTLMEKVSLIETLNEEEQKTLFTILDAFIGKRKLKSALSNILDDVA